MSKKPHLLLVINFLGHNGPSRIVTALALGLLKKYKITILTLTVGDQPSLLKSLKQQGIAVTRLELPKSMSTLLLRRKVVHSAISNLQPDLVHTHGLVPTFFVAKTSYPKITTLHNHIYEDSKYTYGCFKGRLFAKFHLKLLRYFNRIICCSSHALSAIKTDFPFARVINNGVEPLNLKSAPSPSLVLPPSAFVYLFVGSLSQLKRPLELIELFAKSRRPDEYLLLVGDGPLLSAAKELTIKLRIADYVVFTGFKADPRPFFQLANVYLSNSSSEGLSVSVIEALSVNLPLLLSDIPSHRACFDLDKSYYLGELFRSEDFASKKAFLRKKLKAKHKSLTRFQKTYLSDQIMAQEYHQIYRELLS